MHKIDLKNSLKIVNNILQVSDNLPNNDSTPLVADLFQLPANVYFLDLQSKLISGNLNMAHSMRCESIDEVMSKSALNYVNHKSASAARMNDLLVTRKRSLYVVEEEAVLPDKIIKFLSFKMPWMNEKGNILGISGISIDLSNDRLSHTINKLLDLGLLHKKHTVKSILPIHQKLTKQEEKILYLIGKGRTYKMIGKLLNLSARTVEHYTENIKVKFNVHHRSELIEISQTYF